MHSCAFADFSKLAQPGQMAVSNIMKGGRKREGEREEIGREKERGGRKRERTERGHGRRANYPQLRVKG